MSGRLFLACILCGAASVAHAAPPPPPAPEPRTTAIRFGEDLALSDLKLTRRHDQRTVVFRVHPRWKPAEGSRVHLYVSHAPDIDPERSFLVVTLNGNLLRSIRLDTSGPRPAEMVVAVPPQALAPRNELSVEVAQYGAARDAPLWTIISDRSFVSIAHHEQPWTPDLRELPLPLFDPEIPRTRKLAVVLPERLSPATLEATALVLATLSLRAVPREMEVTFVPSLAAAHLPVLIVGTTLEQPALEPLLGSGSAPDSIVGLTEVQAESRPVLYVTAATPEGVLKAARGLAAGLGELAGPTSVVRRDPDAGARAPREWKGFVPPKAEFRLSELGAGPAVLEAPLWLDVRTAPDARFLAYGHSLVLSLRPSPVFLSHDDAALEVAWNDVVLARLAGPALRGKPPLRPTIVLPAALLRSDNVLTVKGTGRGADGPLAAVDLHASELYLPREHAASLPDLALLRSRLFPFSLRADLSDVVLVVPDAITEEIFVLVCEAAAAIGGVVPTDRLAFRVRQTSTLTKRERDAAHLVLLRTDAADPFQEALPDANAARGKPASVSAVLQQAASPWNDGKFLLSLRASSASSLLRAFRTLRERSAVDRLHGDTAYLTPRGPVCLTLGAQRQISTSAPLVHVEAWLRAHSIGIPMLVGALSLLLFAALRLRLTSTASSAS